MSVKIGELLVQRGLITDEQLQHALNAQLVYGGHLGTCLIEQGFVGETGLGEGLADILGVGYVTREMLADIPGPVIDCIPSKLVQKHCLVPFRLASGLLHVAMIDPNNIPLQDELSSVTGLKIRPWVAPEIRIFQAMERYYGIPRRLRFIGLCRELDRPKTATAATTAAGPSTPPSPAPDPTYVIGASVGAETTVNRDVGDLGAEFGYGRSWRELVAEEGVAATATAAATPSPPEPSPPEEEETGVAPPDLDVVADRICRAETVNQLSCSLLDWAEHGTPRCILWRVEAATATPWEWRGFGLMAETARSWRIQVTSEPLFRLVAGSSSYRGPVPADAGHRRYYERLESRIPTEILMFPVYVEDYLVALFYGDSGSRPLIGGKSDDYRRAVKKFAAGLALLRLKQRIRSI